MTKTAVITVPRIEPHRPPAGGAIIAAVCENQGHSVKAYDLNIELFTKCKELNYDFYEFDRIWDDIKKPTEFENKLIIEFIDYWVDKIQKQEFDYILISIFGFNCEKFTKQFLKKLRPKTNSTIVAGGMGVDILSLNGKGKSFGVLLREEKLIDDYISGEGEVSIVEYLNGNKNHPGINSSNYTQVDDLDSLTWPDYKFYKLDDYDYLEPTKKDVFITGSRGCVRKCGYCDVQKYWPKFRWRSGQNIADEIIKHHENHGITNFYFTDSLVNGSRTTFEDMCNKLASYNSNSEISWKGQFIFRRKHQLTDDHFDMIAASGAHELFVGFETGSDRLRFEMDKKFTNEDIDYQLEQLSRVRVCVTPLMFTGYVTETLEDHKETLAIFKRWQKYVADGTINAIELGANLIILPGSPVEKMIESHGIEFAFDNNGDAIKNLWYANSNSDLTIKERIRRKLEIHEEAIKYNWPVWRQEARLTDLKHFIIKNNLHKEDVIFKPLELMTE